MQPHGVAIVARPVSNPVGQSPLEAEQQRLKSVAILFRRMMLLSVVRVVVPIFLSERPHLTRSSNFGVLIELLQSILMCVRGAQTLYSTRYCVCT